MVSGSASNGRRDPARSHDRDLAIGYSSVAVFDFRPAALASYGREGRILAFALLLAILLHASAIVSILFEWPGIADRPVPREIPVDLVLEMPQAVEEVKEAPPPPVFERESGGDPNLAQGRVADIGPKQAPPESSAARPEASASALSEPLLESLTAEFAPPQRKPAPPAPPVPPKPVEAPAVAPQQAPPAQTAKSEQRPPSRLSLIGQGGGDTYLNQIRDMIEKQRSYPEVGNPMQLSGTAIYELRLNRNGEIVSVILLRSTGAGPLDLEGQRIVRRAGPFPPVPANIAGDPVSLRLDLPIHP
jgi:protein TonB